MRSLCLVLCL